MNRFSLPDSSSSTAAYWPVSPMIRRTFFGSRTTSYPPTEARPPSGCSSVDNTRIAVVLPAPLGPSNPKTVPSEATMSIPSSARTSPNVLMRPSASIAAVIGSPLSPIGRYQRVRLRMMKVITGHPLASFREMLGVTCEPIVSSRCS